MYPPTNFVYDTKTNAADAKLAAYPFSKYTASINNKPNPENQKVTWVPANTIKDESGDTARLAEYIAEGYYVCESQAFLTPYSGCGDGVPSNGPPDKTVSPNDVITDKTQRSGSKGYEVCDDGGDDTDSNGYRCSADCKTIVDGSECLEWGKVCTPQCGNGFVEGSFVANALTSVREW